MNKNPIVLGAIAILSLVAAIAFVQGCATQQVPVVDPTTGKTNMVTEINQVNLEIDSEGIKLGAAGAVTVVLQLTKNNPAEQAKVIQALTDAHTALDGILHGANTQTSQDVINILQKSGNASLAKEAGAFALTLSNIEQKWLTGVVDPTIRGQIITAFTQAVCDGIATALNLS